MRRLCRANQLKIANILLKDVFITKDLFVERARVLTWKARMTTTNNAEPLKECNHETLCCFQLIIAYFLRALCIQETEPQFKSSDIISLENVISLLFNVMDLVSTKRRIELHQCIYDLMFRIFKWKNISLAILWDYRRLSHALCRCPINDVVIMENHATLVKYQSQHIFGKVSKAKSIGFELSIHESDITIDEINRTASKLVSSYAVGLTCDDFVSHNIFLSFSSFVVATLYYDLCEIE
ncbi:hypothetical protein HID58_016909 [Brassica napus]|uniref:Uncharacterized protein n=1 Tax=Brassica napus TaxID=3708 RepID=A0ABQ8D7B4_BRANA|nr:hypothetical protein HID58_016909 [Brassica napus]